MNPLDLKRGIDLAVKSVVTELEAISRPITSREEVSQVGSISANGDVEVGRLISDAMEKVGKEGVITVEDGKTLENELEVVEGMKFDRGYISPYFITDPKSQTVELEKPNILLVEKKVSSIQQIIPLLESVIKMQSSLLIVAEDVESEAMATLVVNKLRAGIKVCAVKAPGFGDNRKATMQDLALVTGGTVISEETGMKLEEVTPEHLGTCKKIEIDKNNTIVLGGAGDKDGLKERCDLIRHSIETTKSDYEREKLQERLAKLSGGVAVIRVGGASEVEVSEKKDRVVDALNAAKNMDQQIGVDIVMKALRAPLSTIASNAGEEGAVIVGELIKEGTAVEQGFDAQNGVLTNMFAAGILDPTKVTRTGIVDAASVAGLLTTSESMIVDKPAEGGAMAAPPMGGMGGMPGMGM